MQNQKGMNMELNKLNEDPESHEPGDSRISSTKDLSEVTKTNNIKNALLFGIIGNKRLYRTQNFEIKKIHIRGFPSGDRCSRSSGR